MYTRQSMRINLFTPLTRKQASTFSYVMMMVVAVVHNVHVMYRIQQSKVNVRSSDAQIYSSPRSDAKPSAFHAMKPPSTLQRLL